MPMQTNNINAQNEPTSSSHTISSALKLPATPRVSFAKLSECLWSNN